jgi:hypothetical protein
MDWLNKPFPEPDEDCPARIDEDGMDIPNIGDHLAFTCDCGSVHFHLLRTRRIECADCRLLFGGWESDEKKAKQQAVLDAVKEVVSWDYSVILKHSESQCLKDLEQLSGAFDALRKGE